jgi:hypothetical protein
MDTNKELTSTERGKMMNLYWTQRNKEVVACGHKLSEHAEPRNNCTDCWFAFFQMHGEFTQAVEECFQKEGRAVLVAFHGEKLVKQFLRFMGTLATSLKGANE